MLLDERHQEGVRHRPGVVQGGALRITFEDFKFEEFSRIFGRVPKSGSDFGTSKRHLSGLHL